MKSLYVGLVLVALGCNSRDDFSTLNVTLGHDIELGAYPVVALLKEDMGESYYSYCSGVLLDEYWLLTAAHCSQDWQGSIHPLQSLRVSWGDRLPLGELSQLFEVNRIVVHPGFDSEQMGKDADGLIRPSHAHDLALWQLKEPVKDDIEFAKPHEGFSDYMKSDWQLTIMGFGQASSWESPWEEKQLRMAQTPYHPEAIAKIRVKELVGGRLVTRLVETSFSAHSESEFFAGSQGKPDTCGGDSGGPSFVEESDGKMYLVGITSRGDANCQTGGIYTRVDAHIEWLEATMSAD